MKTTGPLSSANFYAFDHQECLLRLSASRYLATIKSEHVEVWYYVLKECYVNGSLAAKEICHILEAKYSIPNAETAQAIT